MEALEAAVAAVFQDHLAVVRTLRDLRRGPLEQVVDIVQMVQVDRGLQPEFIRLATEVRAPILDINLVLRRVEQQPPEVRKQAREAKEPTPVDIAAITLGQQEAVDTKIVRIQVSQARLGWLNQPIVTSIGDMPTFLEVARTPIRATITEMALLGLSVVNKSLVLPLTVG